MKKQYYYLFILFFFLSCKGYNTIIDSRDGQKYHYVEIKKVLWLTENMRYNVEGSKLNPNNPNSSYGRLYNWEQAMEACPQGWHLAHHTTWYDLEEYFISDEHELFSMGGFRGKNAKILKSKEEWNPLGTDSLGISLLPAGRANNLKFTLLGEGAFFWTSGRHTWGGEFANRYAYFRYLHADSLGIEANHHDKNDNYYSCRCVKFVEKE